MAHGRRLTCNSSYFDVHQRSGDYKVRRSLSILGSPSNQQSKKNTVPAAKGVELAARASDVLVLLMRRYRLALGVSEPATPALNWPAWEYERNGGRPCTPG